MLFNLKQGVNMATEKAEQSHSSIRNMPDSLRLR